MLTAVTEEGGTAVEAAIRGFRVAGKTSTAQKVDPATGKYSTDKYTAVVRGFVPVENPRLVVAVVLDEPTIGALRWRLAGAGLPAGGRGEPALPRRDPLGRTAKIADVKREGDPADATLASDADRLPPRAAPAAAVPGAPPAGRCGSPTRRGWPGTTW